MKLSITRLTTTVLTFISACICGHVQAQGLMTAMPATIPSSTYHASPWSTTNTAGVSFPQSALNGATSRKLNTAMNYKTFTPLKKNLSAEAVAANKGYEGHPDYGVLYSGTPCENCYEVISGRTETTKTFVKEGAVNGSKEKMVQTSTQPMHYRDAHGNWITIDAHLEQDANNKGVYAISAETTPLVINTTAADNFSSLGKDGENIKFNHNLELIYVQADGTQVSLGTADYTHHTAGDEGVYVTNAWPGIDIEMSILHAALKTNFHLNKALPQYADGKLLIRDHLVLGKGMHMSVASGSETSGDIMIKNGLGTDEYGIGAVNIYQKDNRKNTTESLNYSVGRGNTLDIVLPGSYLNKDNIAYPIIIDPLVSLATSVAVNGSTFITALTATSGCLYTNAAMTPANCTVTDIQYAFQYTAVAPNYVEYAGTFFYLGTCRSPGTLGAGFVWTCGPPAGAAPGTCTATAGTAYSIWGTAGASTSGVGPCVPAPACTSYALNIKMYFYQSYLTTAAPCVATYAYGSQPLVITVIGHTVELTAAGVTGSPATICSGATANLSATGVYGVGPYTYSWSPGPVTGSPAAVTPTSTTTYTLTVTDACGITTGGTTTITVNPIDPITGTLTVCTGNTTTLADASGAGTWASSTPTIATVGAGTGVVNGISPGTSTITFTTTGATTGGGGCKAYAVVTVTPLPAAISGTLIVCQGSTTTLTDVTAGGAWSSSNTSVATMSATGVVTGVSGGTTTITYGTTGCVATITVTVNAAPDISATSYTNPTICNGTDGTFTLSGLTAGALYGVNFTGPSGPVAIAITADGSGNVVVTALSAGTYSSITVTNSLGCISNVVGPITLVSPGVPATPVLTNSSPICDGGNVSFTATDATPGVTYLWKGPSGFVSTLQNPGISPAGLSNAGVYTVTVTELGCTSLPGTTVVTVNPIPVLSLVSSTNPTTCGGTNGSITLKVTGLPAGVVYNTTYLDNGTSYGVSIVSGATGNVVITVLNSGTYSGMYVTSPAGCVSNTVGPVQLTDPGAPPPPTVTSNTPLCVGQELKLTAADTEPGGTYTWTFPTGATSTLQDPNLYNTTYADTGIYTVVYNVANCLSYASENIKLYPPIVLTNITPNTLINYGSSIQLNVDGALYYWWRPDNGSLNNTNINNPIATPLDSTVYTVIGTSQWGCEDSAHITITVAGSGIVIPTGFTPNNDGLNDIFRIANLKYEKLVDFSVYNRWGILVYHNTYDPKQGWDGTYNGVLQDMGVYNYVIILANTDGTNKVYKGDVTLIR